MIVPKEHWLFNSDEIEFLKDQITLINLGKPINKSHNLAKGCLGVLDIEEEKISSVDTFKTISVHYATDFGVIRRNFSFRTFKEESKASFILSTISESFTLREYKKIYREAERVATILSFYGEISFRIGVKLRIPCVDNEDRIITVVPLLRGRKDNVHYLYNETVDDCRVDSNSYGNLYDLTNKVVDRFDIQKEVVSPVIEKMMAS